MKKINEMCMCPCGCGYEGPEEDFKPKQYAGIEVGNPKKKPGLEIYITGESEEEND
jgi:hypothetical protein